MAEFRMGQAQQIKKIANFDIDTEERLIRFSVFDFLFHLQAMHDDNDDA